MKNKTLLISFLVLLGLAIVTVSAFFRGRPFPGSGHASASGDRSLSSPELSSQTTSEPTVAALDSLLTRGGTIPSSLGLPLQTVNGMITSPLDLSAQTMNGITVQIESYYGDANRLIFVVRVDGEADDYFLGNISLKQADEELSDSCEVNRLSEDAPIFSIDLTTARPLEGEYLNGQFVFDVVTPDGEDTPLANFRFDLDLPIFSTLIFNPRQSVAANGVEIVLDRVVITPAFTQAYLCYLPPTDADWGIDRGTTLQVNSEVGSLQTYNILFDDKLSGRNQASEPDWTSPVQAGRCVKIGFQVGGAHPGSFKLTIPALERVLPREILAQDLAVAYKKLQAQGIEVEWHRVDHGAYMEYKKLPEGMTRDEAFRRFAEALGYAYPGEWIFELSFES